MPLKLRRSRDDSPQPIISSGEVRIGTIYFTHSTPGQ
jgi:hypothetical protein